MPGIAGIISEGAPVDCKQDLQRMIAAMRNDISHVADSVAFSDAAVYAGWVAPSGSFAAMHSAYDTAFDIALVFSGECYPEEQTDGINKRDWLVRRYERVGQRFLGDLNGLFGGLLIDLRQRQALLFNDRYGVERIYVHETDGATYFASEAKALLAVLPEVRAFDEEGVTQFLTFGCTLGERTLFRGISLLPGGSCWRFGPRGLESKSQYFVPSQWETQAPLPAREYETRLGETFQRVLPRYAEHAESVGISLTGGVDTRMIMACLPESGTPHPCYTFVGQSGLTLDARLASHVASVRGLTHRPLPLRSDFLRAFGTYLDRTVTVTDGCAGATASHEIYFNAQARQLSPVRLTGNFGSEILRSVSTFKPLGLKRCLFSERQAKAVAAAAHEEPAHGLHPVTFAAFREIPWSLFGLLAAGRSQLTFRTPYLDNELVALAYRAPASLRHSPLPALELVRSASPKLARIPTDRGELLGGSVWGHAFRRAFGEVTFKLDYYHTEGLPPFLNALDPFVNALSPFGVLGLHKFLPYRRWFRNELVPVVLERISSDRVRCAPWWAQSVPEAVARRHVAGQGNYVRELNAILTLEAIERLLIAGEPLGVSVEKENDLEAAI